MLNFLILLYLGAFEISCSAELNMKFVYNLGPRSHSCAVMFFAILQL